MEIFFHKEFLSYKIPAGIFDSRPSPYLEKQIAQPEGPERILNTGSVLQRCELSNVLTWSEPHLATDKELLSFHTVDYLQRLKAAESSSDSFTNSTYMFKNGMKVIRLSAGAAIDAVRHVVSGKGKLAYAISRPPSHHAQPDEADGYCFINGVGLAALKALNAGYARVAIIDWDVHHGNGTQAGFYVRDDVLTISMHMNHGSWGSTHIQTGEVDEIGTGDGEGHNVNFPIPFGAGDRCYNELMRRCIVPAVKNFSPDLIVLANGQDANQFDPNGRQCLTMGGYHELAVQVRELANDVCDGKIVMTQEGGYNPSYAPLCAYAVAQDC